MIYTSRYSNKKLREDGYYAVGISLGKPKFPLGYEVREQCFTLAPKGYMLKMEYDPYREEYFKKLDGIGADNVIQTIRNIEERAMAEGKEVVLLCFEDIRKENTWCHRSLFAEWWLKNTGEIIEELEDAVPLKPKKTKNEQVEAERPIDDRYVQLSFF